MKIDLPERFYFRTGKYTFNSRYYTAILDGSIYIKPNQDLDGGDGPWEKMTLPKDLDGSVSEIAIDGRQMIAIDSNRRLYRMDDARGPVEDFFWTDRWGFPFAQGFGFNIREDILSWDISVVSTPEDIMYTDPAGNHQGQPPKNEISCAHLIILDNAGRHLIFNDPWLPADYSYEIGLPYRGRFVAAAMSSSGSTHFIMNKFGDMFTRLYDFDISGYHNIYYPIDYSYEDQRGKDNPKWQLPAEDWKMQPKIDTSGGDAQITDCITIFKVGTYCTDRVLRVEGLNRNGETGFYEKHISDAEWKFHITNLPLAGKFLENRPYDSSMDDSGRGEYYNYLKKYRDFSIRINEFHCYCTPADFVISFGQAKNINLKIHSVGTVRLKKRSPGLDKNPRKYTGAVEVPGNLLENFNSYPDSVKTWLKSHLNLSENNKFTKVKITATSEWMKINSGLRSLTFRTAETGQE